MNERIKELAVETGIIKEEEGYYWIQSVDTLEKFAELLIQECAAMAWWAEQYHMGDGKPISKQITEHFGVEE
jgi:hypothetical protein